MTGRRTNYEMHGESRTRLYRVWQNIHKRCCCETDEKFGRYGGRGITMCDEWRDSFVAFKAWAYANGYDENAPKGVCTIDRIDNDKGYSPDNCRWVGRSKQQNNRRTNHRLTIDGESRTIAEWSRISGNSFGLILERVMRGWGEKDAVFKLPDARFSNGKGKNHSDASV